MTETDAGDPISFEEIADGNHVVILHDVDGAPAACGEAGYTTLERQWVRPALDVNGLYGGYGGEGSKTIIPARAGAKVSMRLVPNQDPDQIADAFDLEYWREHDRTKVYPQEFLDAFAEAGWLGIAIPEAYGGAGLGTLEACLLLYEICASGAGTSGTSGLMR